EVLDDDRRAAVLDRLERAGRPVVRDLRVVGRLRVDAWGGRVGPRLDAVLGEPDPDPPVALGEVLIAGRGLEHHLLAVAGDRRVVGRGWGGARGAAVRQAIYEPVPAGLEVGAHDRDLAELDRDR